MEILKQLLELLFILKNKIFPTENLSKTLDEFYNKLVEYKANCCAIDMANRTITKEREQE